MCVCGLIWNNVCCFIIHLRMSTLCCKNIDICVGNSAQQKMQTQCAVHIFLPQQAIKLKSGIKWKPLTIHKYCKNANTPYHLLSNKVIRIKNLSPLTQQQARQQQWETISFMILEQFLSWYLNKPTGPAAYPSYDCPLTASNPSTIEQYLVVLWPGKGKTRGRHWIN